MPRRRKSFCTVRANQHGNLYFDLFWDKRWKEAAGVENTAENRRRAARFAAKVDAEIAAGAFTRERYLLRFPEGQRVEEFRPGPLIRTQIRHDTLQGFFDKWSPTLGPPKLRRATARQYRSSIRKHVLPTLGPRRLHDLQWSDLAMLQDDLRQRGTGIVAINRALHHALRSMSRDAARSGLAVAPNLYDRRLWGRLDEDSDSEPDPYTPEEREEILAHFRGTHWFAFVFFQFWQGPRPSETTALRRRDVDLKYETASIHKSRVAGAEAGAKTKKSRRTVRLHPNTVKVLRDRWPIGADPDDYVFTTPGGAPIDEQNFGSSPK